MLASNLKEILDTALILRDSFHECRSSLRSVYDDMKSLLVVPDTVPEEFHIGLGELSAEALSFRKNIFSSIFQSMYHFLKIPIYRRLLYGELNYLFRIWVTSADNLLDGESKASMPIRMPAGSAVMREVISIMAADRVMNRILEKAVAGGLISVADSRILSDASLQILLPSAIEESSEEHGIIQRPHPDYVLTTIHKLKTGVLFYIPFLGPERIEKNIDRSLLLRCKDALLQFGLGCQLLDDIRDIAKDHIERRHNYVLSKLTWEENIRCLSRIQELCAEGDVSSRIYQHIADVVCPVAESAEHMLEEGLSALNAIGLGLGEGMVKAMAHSMFTVLDMEDLSDVICNQRHKRK